MAVKKNALLVGNMGLYDGILIKDNHLALAGGVRRAVELARGAVSHLMKIEVEVGNRSQLREAITSRADVIMLGNMSLEEIKESVKSIREQSPGTIIEVSGGVTLENVRLFADCGVDLISVGAITHSVAAVEISLKIRPL